MVEGEAIEIFFELIQKIHEANHGSNASVLVAAERMIKASGARSQLWLRLRMSFSLGQQAQALKGQEIGDEVWLGI